MFLNFVVTIILLLACIPKAGSTEIISQQIRDNSSAPVALRNFSHQQTEIAGKVIAVADGDTLTILDAEKRQHKIRLLGIDAPEKTQAFGSRSKENLSRLVFGKTVTVKTNQTDRYGRVLGTVLSDGGANVNLAQLTHGFAWHYKQFAAEQPDDERELYAATEAAARQKRLGLWQDFEPIAPWEFRRTNNTKFNETPQAANKIETNRSPNAKSFGVIRGNNKSRIYHLPDCPNYEDVSPRNLIEFKTERDAIAAGLRKAKNCR